MSKSGKNRNTGKGKNAAGTKAAAPQSLSAVRAERAVDALTPAFVRWFEAGSPGSAVAAIECLVPITAVMGRYMERTAAADVTRLEPAGLAAAVADEIVAIDAGGTFANEAAVQEEAGFVQDAVGAFVEFLVETGRWNGSADQLAVVRDVVDTAGADGGWGIIDVPDIPDAQALEVFSTLPLIQKATALLRWIGEGRPVTATGALRRQDIEAAAACVGVAAKGGIKSAGSPLPGTAGSANDVPTVRSMYEVPLLAEIWAALESAELTRITATKVVPFEGTEAFWAGGPSEQLEEFEFFTDCFLRAAVLDYDPEQPWESSISGMQATILIAAATADPPEKKRVLAAPDHAPVAEKAMVALLTEVAVSRLEALAELGLLTIDTHFRVPQALIRCIANVFDDDWVLEGLGLGDYPDVDGPIE